MANPDFRVHPEEPPRPGMLHDVRVREDTLNTNYKGQEKKGIWTRAEKAIEKLGVILRPVLGPEEVVLYVARCQAPVSALERITFGWYIHYVTGTVLVFTNRRLLHFDVKSNGDWRRSLRAVNWGDVEDTQIKGWLSKTFELRYRTGKKEKYWNLGREDGKKLRILLDALFAAGARESSPAQTMVSLCPSCTAELTPRVYQCTKCGLKFKDEKTMVSRSLVVPGGGYFYTGHWFLGVGDFLVEAYLLIMAIVLAATAAGLITDPLVEPGQEPITGAAAWIVAGLVAAILAAEKWLTVHHCRRFIREFMPLG
jgi:hypothetical protein